MSFQSLFFCLLYIIVTANCSCVSAEDKSNSTFHPNNEWKKIEVEQAIPPGLHVRINLQTAYKKAKLREVKNDESDDAKSLTVSKENEESNNADGLNYSELKKVLKSIKSDEDIKSSNERGKFRSYDEIKKDFDELNIKVKTDIEILTRLMENFKKFEADKSKSKNDNFQDMDDDEILTSLVDMEYLVHQYDNAKEFAKLNGFSEVIHKSLNSSNSEIRSEALRLHGSATQSNPKVQIAALDSGSINLLLKILTFDEDINVRSRSLYALSCLLRQFPAAQHKLIKDGGLAVFAAVFDEDKQDMLKLQIRIITLIHDLLFERKDTKINILEEGNKNQTNSKLLDLKEKLRQYQNMDLEKKLLEQNWCERISKWFIKQNLLINLEDISSGEGNVPSSVSDQNDLVEKVLDTLYVLSDICKLQFQNDKELMELLIHLKDVYSRLALTGSSNKDDESTQFYSTLSNISKILTEKLKTKVLPKDEL